MQNKLKKAIDGSRNRKVGQNTASPSIANPAKNGSMLIPCRIMLGPACWIVLEKNDREGECSIYLVTLTQAKEHPIPTNSSSEPRGTGPRNRLMKAPVIWKMFDTSIMMDQ